MPSAIPYIRFSSDKQKQGSSSERQQQAVVRWLTDNPTYTLSDLTFADLGKSGYHGDHIKDGGGFAKLLTAVLEGLIVKGDVILVEAIDRTGRLSPLKMLREVISPIIEAGVSIITLDDGVVYDSKAVEGGHLFLLVAKIQAAHGYSKQLSERVTASYAIRRQQARDGKQVKRNVPVWLTTEGAIKSHIAPYIQQAFDLYVSGVGKSSIANRFRASGVAELEKCSGPTVEGWLRNKAAIGHWDDIPNVYPAVVSTELFMLAQKAQKERATTPPQRTSKHFLVGLVKCGTCGSNYIIHHKDNKPNNMRCLTHHRLGVAGCVNAETIPYQVVHYVYLSSADAWIGKAQSIIRLSENEKRKLTLNTERETITATIQKLTRMVATMDAPELESELSSQIEHRKLIDDELSVLERTQSAPSGETRRSFFHGYESCLEHDRLFALDPMQLSALLKQSGYEITVNVGRKITLPDDNDPVVYAGVSRQRNTTLGYRIQNTGMMFVIAKEIPAPIVAVEYSSDLSIQKKFMVDRSYRLVEPPKPIEGGTYDGDWRE